MAWELNVVEPNAEGPKERVWSGIQSSWSEASWSSW